MLKALSQSSLVQGAARLYQRRVGKILSQYGLKYDDLIVESKELDQALQWISKEEKIARTRRMARAADCSLKRTYLPEDIQAIQRPFDGYLQKHLDEVQRMNDEREKFTK